MTTPPPPPGRRPPGLGPHCVGQRVVVRRVVRGETGPTGGPAFTDVLGVMERWDTEGRALRLRREDGGVVEIALDDVASGKPVPPRPSVRHRVSAREVQQRAAAAWPAAETRRLGDWLLRGSAGYTRRANSALASGDPGLPVPAAAAEVRAFYADRGLPALAQVVVDSAEHDALRSLGWQPDGGDTVVLVGGVAAALRALPRPAGSDAAVVLEPEPRAAWLAVDPRALAAADAAEAAEAVLAGPDQVGFASVLDGPPHAPETRLLARARVALDDRPAPWALITDVWVAPAERRRGRALTVVRSLLDWSAERGAATAHLQVFETNAAALALYQRLGFTPHHAYRYLAG